MEPILFYGVPEGCSFGAIVAFEWSGLPYRLCRIQMPEVVSSDAYRAINPVGETPSLLTASGEVISESVAIHNHIAARALGTGIGFAQDSGEFDRLNAMLAFLNTTFFDAFGPLWHVIEHEVGAAERETLVGYGMAKVAAAHAKLESLLDGRDWLVDNRRTLADAYFCGIARWADFHGFDRSRYPGVERLFRRLEADPAVRFAHAIEHEQPAETTGRFRGEVSFEAATRLLPRAA